MLLIGKGTKNFKKQEGVIALGMVQNIEEYYSVGDIIVLPSKFGEGFSNVLAEGMLCKLFPVATKVGDSQNIISNIGLTVRDISSKEIEKSLEIALNFSKKEMIGLQDRACKRIISEFSIKKMSTSYNNIYNEIEMQPHDAFEKFYTLFKKKIKILYLKNIAVIKKTNF